MPIDQKLLLEAYGEAIKGSVAATDSGLDKVITAAFSIATAFGALLGLVSPEDDPHPLGVTLPFALMALAAIAGMLGLVRGIGLASRPTASELLEPLRRAIYWKRLLSIVAVSLLASGVLVAGAVVVDAYGAGAEDAERRGTVFAVIPESGDDVISTICPGAEGSVNGVVDVTTIEEEFVTLEVAAGDCLDSALTLRLPKGQVRAVVLNQAESDA